MSKYSVCNDKFLGGLVSLLELAACGGRHDCDPPGTGDFCTQEIYENADFSGMDLSEAYFTEVDFSAARLFRTILRGAHISDSEMPDVELSEADLRFAFVSDVNLASARMRGANLTQAYLSGVILCDADLRQAKLNGVELSNVTLEGAKLDRGSIGEIEWGYAVTCPDGVTVDYESCADHLDFPPGTFTCSLSY